MASPAEKFKDRLRSIKNPLQNIRRESLGGLVRQYNKCSFLAFYHILLS